MDFIKKMKKLAQREPLRLVMPEALDARIIQAAKILIQERMVSKVVLLGNEKQIEENARKAGLSMDTVSIFNPQSSGLRDQFVDEYIKLRQHKGISRQQAQVSMQNPLYWAAMLLRLGMVDAMVAGAAHSTANVLVAAFRIIKTTPRIKNASSFFVIQHPDPDWGEEGYIIFSDCALIPDPDAEQLAEIAITAAKSCQTFLGFEPKVAMLSFSTKGSANHPVLEKIKEATRLAKSKWPELIIDGELQVDAALIPEIAKMKAPKSPIKGNANVLIFPDLNAGNIAYKLVQRLGGADVYGPFLQGFAKPVSDLSRGCSVENIVITAACTLVQAQKNKH